MDQLLTHTTIKFRRARETAIEEEEGICYPSHTHSHTHSHTTRFRMHLHWNSEPEPIGFSFSFLYWKSGSSSWKDARVRCNIHTHKHPSNSLSCLSSSSEATFTARAVHHHVRCVGCREQRTASVGFYNSTLAKIWDAIAIQKLSLFYW